MATKSALRVGALRWIHPPQQARSQETLDRILDAAEVLVSEKGFEDTPVSEIVRRAESSVGAFYTRFADKVALLNALYERYAEQAIATADDALDPERWQGAQIPELLTAVVRFLVSVYREHRGLVRAFMVRARVDADFQQRQHHVYDHVHERLSALLLARRDEITHPDPARAAAFGLTVVFATLDSTVLFGEQRSGRLAIGDDELGTELARTYLAYLGVTAD